MKLTVRNGQRRRRVSRREQSDLSNSATWCSGMPPNIKCGLLHPEFLFNAPDSSVAFLRSGEGSFCELEHVLLRGRVFSQHVAVVRSVLFRARGCGSQYLFYERNLQSRTVGFRGDGITDLPEYCAASFRHSGGG